MKIEVAGSSEMLVPSIKLHATEYNNTDLKIVL